jgi:hypothetical protein
VLVSSGRMNNDPTKGENRHGQDEVGDPHRSNLHAGRSGIHRN